MKGEKKRAFSLRDVIAPRGIGSIAVSGNGRVAFVVAEPRHTMDYIRRCVEWFRSHLGKDAPKRQA